MNQEYLDSLLGMDLQEAKKKVKQDGYEVCYMADGTITASIARPFNLVELYFDADNKVVNVFNQAVCEAKYRNKHEEEETLGFNDPG